ncbi:hypothetical protein CPB83DRAFT_899393 [Crepidotus variabilis]|uniref:F-box domain-containing protein n=1 Tax=Crepidotus variabilis TaxID=179855 RepID=A0A9P6JIW3_9AGAR|nr:hypothetical protein CPB83DRAFT_899393 [Crepidotus variabilis]
MSVDAAASLFNLPDLRPSLVDYLHRLQPDGFVTNIGGRRLGRVDSHLPFTHLEVWKKLRLQTKAYHFPHGLLPPVTVNAEPPSSNWPQGHIDSVILNMDSSQKWPMSGINGHVVADIVLIFRLVTPPPALAEAQPPERHVTDRFLSYVKRYDIITQSDINTGIRGQFPESSSSLYTLKKGKRTSGEVIGDIVPLDQSRKAITLLTLPDDVLLHLFLHLPLPDILVLRQCCRRLQMLSYSDIIWQSILHAIFGHLIFYPQLKRLASWATQHDDPYEATATRLIQSELGWKHPRAHILRGISDNRESNRVFWSKAWIKVINGGRWMLWSPPERDRLMVYDLHQMRLINEVLLGPKYENGQAIRMFEHVAVQVDYSSPGFSIHLAFLWFSSSPTGIAWGVSNIPQGNRKWVIQVYRLVEEERSSGASLYAHPITTIEGLTPGCSQIVDISVNGHLVACAWQKISFHHDREDYTQVEVFSLQGSSFTQHSKSTFSFHLVQCPVKIHLLTDNQVVVCNSSGLYIFDIPHPTGMPLPSHPLNVIAPTSRYIFPVQFRGSVSPPHLSHDAAHFVMLFSTGIYGLVIPYPGPHPAVDHQLEAIELVLFKNPIPMDSIGCARIGIHKAYIWPEGQEGFALTYVWPDADGLFPNSSPAAECLGRLSNSFANASITTTPYGWGYKNQKVILAPHLDEMSGRLLSHVNNRGWGSIEFR